MDPVGDCLSHSSQEEKDHEGIKEWQIIKQITQETNQMLYSDHEVCISVPSEERKLDCETNSMSCTPPNQYLELVNGRVHLIQLYIRK